MKIGAYTSIILLLFVVFSFGLLVSTSYSPYDPTDSNYNRDHWEQELEAKPADGVYQSFKNRNTQAKFETQHFAAHVFGEVLYDRFNLEGINVCDQSFNFGCYHGFFGIAVATQGISIIKNLDTICGKLPNEDTAACRHGIGHGILENLGSEKLSDALQECLKTTQPNPFAGCTSGVFMEFNIPIRFYDGQFHSVPRELNQADPFEPCNNVDEQFRESCYHELPQWWSQVMGQDYRTLGEMCASVTVQNYSRACFIGIGTIVAPNADFEPYNTLYGCNRIRDERGAYLCRASAAWHVSRFGEGIESSRIVCGETKPEFDFSCQIDSLHD